ncbi:LRRC7 protein, partial [Cettia cetti]|nr:LRRC7 protein [Cettia cetti]
VCCLEMTSKRKLIGRLVPCRCFRGEEEIVSVLDYSHCGLQQVPKEVFNFERTLEELYLDANQIEELPKIFHWKFLWDPVAGSGVTAALGSSQSLLFKASSP